MHAFDAHVFGIIRYKQLLVDSTQTVKWRFYD